MTNYRRYEGEYEAGEKRGHTPSIFERIDRADILTGNRVRGFGFANDFLSDNDLTDWFFTQATAGTAKIGDARGGVLNMDTVAANDAQGVQLQYGAGDAGGESFIPAAGTTICCELNVKTDIAGGDVFFGLSETDTTVITGSAVTSANHIGFESLSADGVLLFFGEKAGTRNTTGVTTHTMVAGTEVLLGFRVNGLDSIEIFVNRELIATTIPTANIPIVEMTPTIVVQGDAANAPVYSFDWFDCFQQDNGD